MKRLPISQVLYALIAGCFLPFAFSPHGVWPLAIVCPAVLLHLWLKQNARQAFISGWLFGLGFFAVGVWWVFISIHEFGNTNAVLAFILTALFVIFLGFWFGVQGLLFHWLNRSRLRLWFVLLFPAIWLFFAWLFEWVLTGFPWLQLGTSQVASPLAGYLPLFGILGTSGIVALCSALLLPIFKSQITLKIRMTSLFLFIIIFALGGLCRTISWSGKLPGKPMNFALVQGNIAQSLRWDPNHVDAILTKYRRISTPYFKNNTLVVWPENALPIPASYASDYLYQLHTLAKENQSTLITGMPVAHQQDYYNGLLMLGQHTGHYFKRHLVPFGEYLPYDNYLRGLINFFNIPMSNFVPGPASPAPLSVGKLVIAPLICYEIAYSSLLRPDLPRADAILVISDDAWFGDSAAASQQIEISRAQAIASARPLLAASNNGITAVISPKGEITQRAPRFKTAILTGTLSGYRGATPWVAWGDLPVILFILIVFIASLVTRHKRKNT